MDHFKDDFITEITVVFHHGNRVIIVVIKFIITIMIMIGLPVLA